MNEIPATEPPTLNMGNNGRAGTPDASHQATGRSAEKPRRAATPTARFLLVRPGCTDYDQQRRIKGRLDIPLNEDGARQVAQTSNDTADVEICSVYSAPCLASVQTAESIAAVAGKKVKSTVELHNLDHGLWEGKLIEQVKSQQPKVYRRWQIQPETVCPPEGEMLEDARRRLIGMVEKALKKHKSGVIAFVLPEPIATVFSCQIQGTDLGDLWQIKENSGKWELIDYHADLVEDENT